jgi:NAD(P)-dependent dehydrogenase (short-subunit alcohol dehydrogenase family)
MISPPERNNGKVAIITGASQGIGAGLSKAYRERGYAVIVTARSIGPSEDSGIVAVEGGSVRAAAVGSGARPARSGAERAAMGSSATLGASGEAARSAQAQ